MKSAYLWHACRRDFFIFKHPWDEYQLFFYEKVVSSLVLFKNMKDKDVIKITGKNH